MASFNNALELSYERRLLPESNKTGCKAIAQNFGIFDICRYGDMYRDEIKISIRNKFWDHCCKQ